MAEKAGNEDAGRGEGDALQTLRERVLRSALNVLAVAVPGISVVIIIGSLRAGLFDPTTLVLSLYTLSFPLLRWFSARLGFRASALALLFLLALTGFLVEVRGGVGTGNILVNALVLLLGALFFGKRGAAFGLGVVVGLFALAGFLVVNGYVPAVTKSMWDSTTAPFWVRETIALFLVGLAVTVAQVYVVERLASHARRLARLADQEHHQRLALESAERERERERDHRLRVQKALEESRRFEGLSRMAGGIAHDFNNSLTVIMGAAEEVRRAETLPEATDYAGEIIAAARQAAELTRQLLMLGRQQVSAPQPVRLFSLFERMQATFRRVLPDDIVLEMGAPPAELAVHVDPTDLERALVNLVLNARDAMPRGGRLQIEVEARNVAADDSGLLPGRYVELRVSDTGEGIAPAVLAHIFEPFFTTKTVGMGTGLGLATVYAFATEAGGTLRVRSSPGTGATFTLLLPESAARAALPEVASPSLAAVEGTGAAGSVGTRVFVVEDNPIVRDNMVQILRRDGFQVTAAADGDEAMAMLASDLKFSVLCIDGVMPGASTREVIEKAEARLPNMRVLLCSGHLREELLRRGVAAGRYAFLPKPFSASELLTAVRNLTVGSG